MLIIEHESLIAMDVSETMAGIGFGACRVALSYASALAEIDRAMPDYAVVDIHIDAPAGGERLLRRLRDAGCRCVVFSADGDACRRLAVEHPSLEVVAKPAQPDQLIRAVTALRSGDARKGAAQSPLQSR